ncbi:hypothetical protein LABO110987_04375 [Lactobacillus bombicola]|nr:hypothetical protein [Lactobacillus bombicola]
MSQLAHEDVDSIVYYIIGTGIGGGVTSEKFLAKVWRTFKVLLNDYVHFPSLEQYITMFEIIDNGSAIVGNFALAKRLLRE